MRLITDRRAQDYITNVMDSYHDCDFPNSSGTKKVYANITLAVHIDMSGSMFTCKPYHDQDFVSIIQCTGFRTALQTLAVLS